MKNKIKYKDEDVVVTKDGDFFFYHEIKDIPSEANDIERLATKEEAEEYIIDYNHYQKEV